MKLILALLCTILLHEVTFGNDVIKIPKQNKVKSTFSGDISDSDSFHLILTENTTTNSYEIFSYHFDGNVVKVLPKISTEHEMSLLSYYSQNDKLALLFTYKDNKSTLLQQIIIETKDNNITLVPPIYHNEHLVTIRNPNNVILVYLDRKKFTIKVFKDFNEPLVKSSKLEGRKDPLNQFFRNGITTAVNLNEFVANGAISNIRAYLNEDVLYFTKNSVDFSVEVLHVDLNNEALRFQLKTYGTKNDNIKNYNSFINDHKLFLAGVSKDQGNIFIYNLKTHSLLSTVILNDNLLEHGNTGIEFTTMKEFRKQASKNNHIVTITANETLSDCLLVRVDYVDQVYTYNYDWWWWHQWMMFDMQQNMIRQNAIKSIPRFGPAPEGIPELYFDDQTDQHYLQFLVDKKGKVKNYFIFNPRHIEIDKKHYIDILDKITYYKYDSSCFVKSGFRYIAYDRKFKQFYINSESY